LAPGTTGGAPPEGETTLSGVSAADQEKGVQDDSRRASRTLLETLLTVVKYFTRYALLAVGAYVMLTCFHLHPAGLLLGALTPFLAALGQLVHASRTPSGRKHLV
jgi:hypothetical protein